MIVKTDKVLGEARESDIQDLSSYLTSESDPIFTTHQAFNITTQDITNLGNLSGVNTGDQDLNGYLLKSGSIADIATRSHTLLTDIGTLPHATIDNYLNQAVKTTSSPTFVRGIFSQATGTSPFSITSTTVNTNLNADLLDGLHSSSFEPTLTAGTSAQYYRGDKSWQTLNQAAVAGLTTASTPTFANLISTGYGNFGGTSSGWRIAVAGLPNVISCWTDGWINYSDPNGGTGTFKTLYIGNGKGSALATFNGAGNILSVGGAFTATGNITTSASIGVGAGVLSNVKFNIGGSLSDDAQVFGMYTSGLSLKPSLNGRAFFGYFGGNVDTGNGNLLSGDGFYVAPLTKTGTNSITLVSGLNLQKQTVGTGNAGILLYGDSTVANIANCGSAVVFGAGQDSAMAFDGIDTVLANLVGTGTFNVKMGLTLSAQNIITDTTTGMKIGTATTQKLGFWNTTPVIQQVTNAYTTDTESSAYTGIDNAQAGTVYAQLTDLNILRVAYDNLRASYDDLLTKLKTTGVVA